MSAAPVALVTGAAKRVGRAIALALARRGWDIAVHFRASADDAAQAADQIRRLGRRAALLPCDLLDPAAAASLPDRCIAELGGLNALVNNAADFRPMRLADLDLAEWNRTLAVNLTAPALLSRRAAALMPPKSSIVNIADIAAERPYPGYLAYCVSKAALVALTKALASGLAPKIRVNAVAPGVAAWPDDFPESQRAALVARIPAARPGAPEDVAAAVLFLIADAPYLTGVILNVDGGRSIAW